MQARKRQDGVQAKPTSNEAATVPAAASRPICQRYLASSFRSICSAPANSSMLSIPSISTSEKSMAPNS